MTHLALTGISKIFGDSTVVRDFNLEVQQGEFVSFLGPSGCGKTTTLRMIAGFEIPTSGKVTVDDADITQKPPNQRNVGMVFQSYALFPNMTVAQNIGFGLQIRRQKPEAIQQRVSEMLALIHLDGRGGSYPYQLSGGQQQRVALARALAIQPEVLLLDEPLSALDAKIRVALRAEIRAIQQKLGITAIYVTHDQEEALSISDRIVVMYDGRIEIYNVPATAFVASFVGTLNTTEVEVVDPKANSVRLEGQQIQAADGLAGKHAGEKARIAIRPERISFASDGKKDNLVDCTVLNITFLGSIVRLQIGIGSQTFHMDEFNNPYLKLPGVGEKIQVTFSREAVLVLSH